MFNPPNAITGATRNYNMPSLLLILCLGIFSQGAAGQDKLTNTYPELANLFNAFDVTHGALLESIVAINADPSTSAARSELNTHLKMLADMSMSDMMSHGMPHSGHDMVMAGPYDDLESASRAELIAMLKETIPSAKANAAFEDSSALDTHTAQVFQRGRQFESRLFEIYLDDSISDKDEAVNAAIQEYLTDARHSLPALPKSYVLLSESPTTTAFQTAFPKLSGLLWSNQWLQLAALEGVLMEYSDPQFSNTVQTALERYWNKVGSASGMTMFPPPVDIPTAAAIAPHLYSFHPQASIILDNLNLLETVVADILSYPDLSDRQPAIDAVVAEFTNKETNIVADYEYLLAALRGGIYNQGGPAFGALDRSERNRSRMDMNMKHTMIMSAPQ